MVIMKGKLLIFFAPETQIFWKIPPHPEGHGNALSVLFQIMQQWLSLLIINDHTTFKAYKL